MKTAGGKPDQNISRHNRLGIENPLPFDDSDYKASQIIFTVGEITGMLCGLAPDQDTARLTTSRSNALDTHFSDIAVKLATDEIAQEEKRLGALMVDLLPAHGQN